jgi:RNA polymerase sigma factor (sigma-70 family)
MKGIRDKNLVQLLKQLKFTPPNKRLEQLSSAEKLFCEIDPEKIYPFEFVFYRITGFRPKRELPDDYIKGENLRKDLRVFILKLNKLVAQPIQLQNEKIYTITELAEFLNVSTKTIRRWYKYGLIPRRFIYEDRIKRLGYPKSKVDKFIKENKNTVLKARRFGRINEKQKKKIINKAKQLSPTLPSLNKLIEKIYEDTGTSKETIRKIIYQHDKKNPDKKIITSKFSGLSPHQYSTIYKLYKQGYSAAELTMRFNRSRSSIYRIINKSRAKKLTAIKIDYIPSPEFENEKKLHQIISEPLTDIIEKNHLAKLDSINLQTNLKTDYLQTPENIVSLSKSQETRLFKKYNCLKYAAAKDKEKINLTRVSGKLLKKIEKNLYQADFIKNIIIKSNLKLLIAIARKHITVEVGLSELSSEGSLSLMRAVEKFDYNRNVRFATYASWAIAKSFARKVPAKSKRIYSSNDTLENIQQNLRTVKVAHNAIERANKNLLKTVNEDLDKRERHIILNHFGLQSQKQQDKKTLKQIGDQLNLSKERVRQIELIALQKLRHSLSKQEFDLLTK